MKNKYFFLIVLFTIYSYSQSAEFLIDFENFNPLSNAPTRISVVDAVTGLNSLKMDRQPYFIII